MAEEANDSKSAAAGSADNMDGQIMGEVSGINENFEENLEYSSSDDDEDAVEWYDLDADILKRLKQNDPSIGGLNIVDHGGGGSFNPLSIDWGKESEVFANNTHLKSVNYDITGAEDYENRSTRNYCYYDEDNEMALCSALYKSRSISDLTIYKFPQRAGDIFKILSPFFEHNHNLRSVNFSDDEIGQQIFTAIGLSFVKDQCEIPKKFRTSLSWT